MRCMLLFTERDEHPLKAFPLHTLTFCESQADKCISILRGSNSASFLQEQILSIKSRPSF